MRSRSREYSLKSLWIMSTAEEIFDLETYYLADFFCVHCRLREYPARLACYFKTMDFETWAKICEDEKEFAAAISLWAFVHRPGGITRISDDVISKGFKRLGAVRESLRTRQVSQCSSTVEESKKRSRSLSRSPPRRNNVVGRVDMDQWRGREGPRSIAKGKRHFEHLFVFKRRRLLRSEEIKGAKGCEKQEEEKKGGFVSNWLCGGEGEGQQEEEIPMENSGVFAGFNFSKPEEKPENTPTNDLEDSKKNKKKPEIKLPPALKAQLDLLKSLELPGLGGKPWVPYALAQVKVEKMIALIYKEYRNRRRIRDLRIGKRGNLVSSARKEKVRTSIQTTKEEVASHSDQTPKVGEEPGKDGETPEGLDLSTVETPPRAQVSPSHAASGGVEEGEEEGGDLMEKREKEFDLCMAFTIALQKLKIPKEVKNKIMKFGEMPRAN